MIHISVFNILTPSAQIDETVYYDTTSHMPFPYPGSCHAAPWGVNQLEYSADFTRQSYLT